MAPLKWIKSVCFDCYCVFWDYGQFVVGLSFLFGRCKFDDLGTFGLEKDFLFGDLAEEDGKSFF